VQLAFPHDKHAPALAAQPRPSPSVACGVAFQFRLPETRPRLGNNTPESAGVPVPETAMHEYDRAAGSEDQIRLAWQRAAVQSIAIAQRSKQSTNDHFRAGVFAAYGGHATGALQRGENVHGQPLANALAQSKNSDT